MGSKPFLHFKIFSNFNSRDKNTKVFAIFVIFIIAPKNIVLIDCKKHLPKYKRLAEKMLESSAPKWGYTEF